MPPRSELHTPDLVEVRRTWISVVRAYNLCSAALTARLASINLHLSEHEVLVILSHAPHITQQDLASRSFVAKSGISMLLKRMEAQGLVARETDEKDGRIKRLALTAAGSELAAEVLAIQSDVLTAMTKGCSAHETALVFQVMERISTQLEALDA